MTPQQKADELVERFSTYAKNSLDKSSEFTPIRNAIQCAIICVEEILSDTGCGCCKDIDAQYWQSVLNELKSRL